MKHIIWAVVFFLVALLISDTGYGNNRTLLLFLAFILGYVFSRQGSLNKELRSLREVLAKDWEERHAASSRSQSDTVSEGVHGRFNEHMEQGEAVVNPVAGEHGSKAHVKQVDDHAAALHKNTDTVEPKSPTPVQQDHTDSGNNTPFHIIPDASADTTPNTPPEPPLFIRKIKSAVMDYFTGGNLFVRVGIILLFLGVSFLLRFVSEQGLFPIEYRLMSIVAAAIGLLIFGWRLRLKKPEYALLVQGAAVGVLYLTIFSAYSFYHLLPALPTFAILLLISLFTAALAVLQNSQALAFWGFSGGFLAPILASSGSNNYIGLFSYYLVLNLALLGVAWFKAWRPLNLLGFVFTFIVSTTWGVLRYKAAYFSTVEPFLIAFFLMYVAIAVLFALRQPPKLKGYVDGSLLFGVPLAASGLQYALVKDFEYGIALSAFVLGLFYIALAWGVWKKAGDSLRLLAETFLALGVIFASLAIPYAVDPSRTAAAWALEGAGMIWLGSRQQRYSVRIFGLLLFCGAMLFVVGKHSHRDSWAFLNSTYLSTLMLALGSLFSARILYKPFAGKREWETSLSPVLLGLGVLWLLGGFAYQIEQHFGSKWLLSSSLLFTTAVAIVFTLLAQHTKPAWQHAWSLVFVLLAVMVFDAITPMRFMLEKRHPAVFGGWYAWPLAFAGLYWIFAQLEKYRKLVEWQAGLHTTAALLLIALLTWEGEWLLQNRIPAYSGWHAVWLVTPALLGLWASIKSQRWPFSAHRLAYLHYAGAIWVSYFAFGSIFAIASRGSSEVIPWLPVLNAIDITLAIVWISIFHWWKAVRDETHGKTSITTFVSQHSNRIFAVLGIVGFIWLNFTLFRIMYHYFHIPYQAHSLFHSPMVQTSLSILWALVGVILTVVASHKKQRLVWFAGGGLLALVVIKLFLIDLSGVGNLARIISFLVVGVLLTSIGYFAPIPIAPTAPTDETNRREKAREAASDE